MSSRSLLGEYVPPDDTVELKRKIKRLEEELNEARGQIRVMEKQASAGQHAFGMLRKELSGLYGALRAIFGELDAAGVGTSDSSSSSPGSLSPRWEMLKKRLGSRQAEIIEVLQHGPMTSSQMSAALHWDIRTTQKHISAMKVAGYLSKNGNQFSLRES